MLSTVHVSVIRNENNNVKLRKYTTNQRKLTKTVTVFVFFVSHISVMFFVRIL